jgi:hypothetical protein
MNSSNYDKMHGKYNIKFNIGVSSNRKNSLNVFRILHYVHKNAGMRRLLTHRQTFDVLDFSTFNNFAFNKTPFNNLTIF